MIFLAKLAIRDFLQVSKNYNVNTIETLVPSNLILILLTWSI